MNRQKIQIILLILFVHFILFAFPSAGLVLAQTEEPHSSIYQYVPNELLLKLKPGRNISSSNIFVGGKVLEVNKKTGLQRMKLPPGTTVSLAMSFYANSSDVEYVEPNYIRKSSFVPSDPALDQQWGLNKINAKQAWDISQGSPSIVIAIIDSGIDIHHPDLAEKIASTYNAMLDRSDPPSVQDDIGHGTHVAGIAAAAFDNGTGVAGIGGRAKLMVIKAGTDGTFYDSNLEKAIYFAIDNGAKVINLSLGGPDNSLTLQRAIDYAVSNNIIVVASAGNTGTSQPMYPAAGLGVIAVAATEIIDVNAPYSNWGSFVDISAPGTDIYSTFPTYPTKVEPSYGNMSGTSMAAPFVSGLAALVLSVNPGLTAEQTANLIFNNARDIGTPGRDDYTGYGRIDAYKTLAAADTAAPFVTSTDPVNNAVGVPVDKNISLVFAEPIKAGTDFYSISIRDQYNQSVAVSASINAETLTISPTLHRFKHDMTYSVVMPKGAVQDMAGNSLANSYSLRFSTSKLYSGVENGKVYNTTVYPAINEGTATLNGQPFQSGTAVANDGNYVLEISDGLGTITTVTFSIDKTPPALVIDSPSDNLEVYTSTVAVVGKAEPSSQVKIGGVVIALDADGQFTKLLPLAPGLNTISVTATDAMNNITTITHKVTYIAPASGSTGIWNFVSDGTSFSPALAWCGLPNSYNWQKLKPVTGDFNGDGKQDVAAFYDFGNTTAGLVTFISDGLRFRASEAWKSLPGNFSWESSKLVSGDFNGDGRDDIAVLYNYNNSTLGLWVFTSNGATFLPNLMWKSLPGNFSWEASKLTGGDINGDGLDDVSVLYNYGSNTSGIWTFVSTGTTFTPKLFWRSTPGNFAWANSLPVAGDFDHDGKTDVAVVYNYGSSTTGLWAFLSNGNAFVPKLFWKAAAGNYAWERSKPVAADFNADGYGDIGIFYNYGNNTAGLWNFQSNGLSFLPKLAWQSRPGNFSWERSMLLGGDATGDKKDDVQVIYRY